MFVYCLWMYLHTHMNVSQNVVPAVNHFALLENIFNSTYDRSLAVDDKHGCR